MQIITSKENETIKNIKKLKEKKYRDKENCYLVEGIKLASEAMMEKARIKKIVVCEECLNKNSIDKSLLYEIAKYDCIYVTEAVFKSITDVASPQGIMLVIEKEAKKTIDYNQDVIVILDGVQDPGNIGTILRTVDSVNLKQIIVSKNCGDVYNTKVIRSTMGAIFRLNVIESENLEQTIKEIQKNKYKVVATSLNTEKSIYDIEYQNTAIIIGNEANGVSEDVMKLVDEKVIIPMPGKTESLNASVATGVILYEYVRRKGIK